MPVERSLAELATDLAGQAGDLIRNEVRMARAEAVESLKAMGGGIVRAALGIALAGAAVALGLFALAYALAEMMPMWAAALIGAVIGAILAYILIKSGVKAASAETMALPKTAEQVGKDLHQIKESITP